MGLPYVLSNFEAEATCSKLNLNQKADFVISKDMDCLPFGKCLNRLQLFDKRYKK